MTIQNDHSSQPPGNDLQGVDATVGGSAALNDQRPAYQPYEYPHSAFEAEDTGVVLRTTRYQTRRQRRWIFWLLIPLLVLAAATMSGLWYVDQRLAAGPIELPALGSRIAASLSERAGKGFRFEIGKSSLQKTSGRPAITLDELKVFGDDGGVILSAPNAVVSLDWIALLSGTVRPRRLAVSGLDLNVSVAADGSLSVSAGRTRLNLTGPATDAPPQPRGSSGTPAEPSGSRERGERAGKLLAAALTRLFERLGADTSQLSSLRRIGITGGRLVFKDDTHSRQTTFSGLDMNIGRSHDELSFTMSAIGPAGRWKVETLARRSDHFDIRVSAQNLSLDDVALIGGLRNLAFDFDGRFDGALNLSVSPAGAIGKAEGRFASGKGLFVARDKDFEPVLVDRLAGKVRWDKAGGGLLVEDVEFSAGLNKALLAGRLEPPAAGSALWRMTLETRGAMTAAHQVKPGQTVPLQKMHLALALDPANQKLVIDRFSMAGEGVNLLLSGSFGYASGDRRLKLLAQVDPAPVDTLLSIWPAFVAPPVRLWAMENLSGGTVQELKVKLDFKEEHFRAMGRDEPLPETASEIRYRLSGVTLSYLPGARPLTGVTATGVTRGSVAHVTIGGGTAVLDKGRKLRLAAGKLDLRGVARDYAKAQLELRFGGRLEDLAALLRQRAFQAHAPRDMDFSAMSGKLEADVNIRFNVSRMTVPADPKVAGRLKMSGLKIANFAGDAPLENGKLDVTLADGVLTAAGTGRLFAASTQLKLQKRRGSPVQGMVKLVLDDAARAKMGWDSDGTVSGPVAVKMTGALAASSAMRGDVTLDLTKARLAGFMPGFDKPAGRPASATFKLSSQRDGVLLDDFRFRSQDFSVRGAIRLDKDNRFRSARLSELKMSPGDDLRADIRKIGNSMKVALTGAAIDLRPLVSGRKAPKSSGSAQTLSLSVSAGIATGYNGQVLSAFRLELEKDKAGISKFQLRARAGKGPLEGRMVRRGEQGPTVVIDSTDAGTILSFLNVYKRMERGRMRLTARVTNAGIDGALDVRNFLLRNEPALRQLVARGAPNSPEGPAGRIDATAVPFQKLQFGFQRDASRLVIRDGIISGTQIGLTLAGMIDFRADRVALRGTFVPAYGLNNVFARIPLFGPLLGGGRNEGLLGVNFAVSGSASRPILNINPLSAIAPGFLRKIFGALPTRR